MKEMPLAASCASTQSDHSVIITPPSPCAADTVHTDDDKWFLWLWTHNKWSSTGSRQISVATCHVCLLVKQSVTINMHHRAGIHCAWLTASPLSHVLYAYCINTIW